MRNRLGRACLVVLALLLVSGRAWADGRQYLETYPYFTAPEGESQLFLWSDWFDGLPRYQVEVQHAFTDRLQASVYGVWQNFGDGTRYQSTVFESRYRLARYKKLFVDPALYVSYTKSAVSGTPDNAEAILILSKDFGNLNLTGNASWERDMEAGAPIEFHYTLAASYPINQKTNYGIEAEVFPAQHQTFLIPGIYATLGRNTWLNLGVSIATQPSPQRVNLRSILWFKL